MWQGGPKETNTAYFILGSLVIISYNILVLRMTGVRWHSVSKGNGNFNELYVTLLASFILVDHDRQL